MVADLVSTKLLPQRVDPETRAAVGWEVAFAEGHRPQHLNSMSPLPRQAVPGMKGAVGWEVALYQIGFDTKAALKSVASSKEEVHPGWHLFQSHFEPCV